jgi:hypothetical protein
MAVPFTAYKIQGQTSGAVAIVTVDIDIMPSGGIRFKPANGHPVFITDPEALKLFEVALGVQFLGK